MRLIYFSFLCILLQVMLPVMAQTVTVTDEIRRCATMEQIKQKFVTDAKFKQQFEQNNERFNEALKQGVYPTRSAAARNGNTTHNARTTYTIPVVFHVVLTNPAAVTDAQIQQQLDMLNADFAGANADSTKIPSYFKPLFGKSSIQFVLAQQTPAGDATTGIERITTTRSSFNYQTSDIKYTASRGADSWDTDAYYNIWICALSNSILGYATFPEDGPAEEQGVAVDYRTLPGGGYSNYNLGRTLTHETGHFFNLYHIWGDDDGTCNGSDFVNDTPDQANASSGCYTGVRTDACGSGTGIMYQNYMDYSNDACLVMFTNEQVSRMEAALLAYRSSLINSDGAQSAVFTTYNAEIRSIDSPNGRICSNAFAPVVTIRNRGSQTLTSLLIQVAVDDAVVSTYTWIGALSKSASSSITLNGITTSEGEHTLSIYISQPNGQADEEISNDTLTTRFLYYSPVSTIHEGFEENTFPPTGWDIVNADQGLTWQKVTGIAKTGNASVRMNNFDYSTNGQNDDLRLPALTINAVDSVYLSFYVAAATYTSVSSNSRGNSWDTLQVLVSTDCGKTYTSLYKKYGSSLVTRTTPATTSFVPTASEWRKDSIDLGNYIGAGDLWIAFRNTTEYENNIYLDDIHLRTVTINENLKEKGFLASPSPGSGPVSVQFYPQPQGLQSIRIVSTLGQQVAEKIINGSSPASDYTFDISQYAAGVYIVQAIFADHVLVKKIVKY